MQEKKRSGVLLSVIGAIMCSVFGIMLLCNLIIIIKGVINPEIPPSILGITPMVVQSGSMSSNADDHIEVDDLIFVSKIKPDKLEKGDIISFMENGFVVTHRIIEIDANEDGGLVFTTKGDANNIEDENPVTEDMVIGIYKTRLPGVGRFAMFLQKPLGMLAFIGVPLCSFIIYDVIIRQRASAKEHRKNSELEREIERLRNIAANQEKESDSKAK